MTDRLLQVVIGEDHPVFCEGLRAQLNAALDIEVVGEAANGTEVVSATTALKPQVVIMDLHMPECGGVEATRQIMQTMPEVAVLVLTMYDDDDLVFATLRAGARGYLLKEASGGDIVRAVRAVAQGEAVFGPRVADRVLRFFSQATRGTPSPFPQLTNRELEVLDLVARGLNNNAIARRLTLSEKTVRNRVSDVLAKLHVVGRAEAVAAARDAGLGTGA